MARKCSPAEPHSCHPPPRASFGLFDTRELALAHCKELIDGLLEFEG